MGSRNSKCRMIYWKISNCKQLARCSLFAKLLFTWLIPNTDDLGRMEGEPEIIKGMLFPYDREITKEMILEGLQELSNEKLISWYIVDGNYYIEFPSFIKYQKLRQDRTYNSDYPPPSDIPCHDMSGQGGQNLREEKRSEEKRRRSEGEVKEKESDLKSAAPVTPYTEIYELYNSVCTNLPKAKILSDTRKKAIKALWNKYPDIKTFKEIFSKANESNFMQGNNDRDWKGDFDWLLKEANIVKVLEGKYDNKTKGGNNSGGHKGNTESQSENHGHYDKHF